MRQIGEALQTMRSTKVFLTARREDFPLLYPYSESLPDHRDVEDRLLDSLEGDGTMRDDASPALASIRGRKKAAAYRISERIQTYTTRYRELLSDPIYTVRDGRYVVPLKAENRGKIKGIIHDTSSTGQTLFIEPEDVLQLGNALRELEAEERGEEARILALLSRSVGRIAVETTGGVEAASRLDLAFAKARMAYDMKGCLPRPVPGSAFVAIQGGRHPLLDPEQAVPLDVEVGRGSSVLITGPNTGGKTVAIKCVGLVVLMVQSGLFPPALDVRLAPFTSVWADIGDEQSLEQSLSTFSGHIKNIAEALRNLGDGALVLLDEVGAGTDPAEGAALAKAILAEMADKGAT
ncbi:endonuclease MutS2, partial [bacterium]